MRTSEPSESDSGPGQVTEYFTETLEAAVPLPRLRNITPETRQV